MIVLEKSNSCAHRDYASTASVEVRVFSDRVEVWNPGELSPGKTVAWLFDEHESMPFNPLIAAAFYQARYIEHVGSGIEDVEVACAEAGLPQTTVDVRNRTIVHTIWRKTTKKTGKTSKKTSKKTIKKTGQVFLLPDGLSDAARKIAETMLSNPWISARGAAEMLGLTQQGGGSITWQGSRPYSTMKAGIKVVAGCSAPSRKESGVQNEAASLYRCRRREDARVPRGGQGLDFGRDWHASNFSISVVLRRRRSHERSGSGSQA